MHKKLAYTFIMILLLTFSTTGCWDQLDIEDVGIVVAAALDKITGAEQSNNLYEPKFNHPLQLTHQLLTPEKSSQKENQSEQDKPYTNITSRGSTWYKLARDEQVTWSNRPPYGQLIKIIIIGKDAAKSYDLRNLLDAYQRDQSILNSVHVFIADGLAEKVLNINAKLEKVPSFYLLKLSSNYKKTPMIVPASKLYKVTSNLENHQSFVMQRVRLTQSTLNLSGGAMIHGKTGRLIGWLNDKEAIGYNFITGNAESGSLEVVDSKSNKLFDYEFVSARSNISARKKDRHIHFDIHIDTKGRLAEDWLTKENDMFQEKNIHRLEKETAKEIKKISMATLQRLQHGLKTDIFGFGKKLSIQLPEEWAKLQKDWDRHFAKATFHILVHVHIREFGTKGGN